MLLRTKRREDERPTLTSLSPGCLSKTLAVFLFHLKGYRIVAQRYRLPVGEIDLVALKCKRLVFVEVK